MEDYNEVIANLDVFVSFALASRQSMYPYTRPRLSTTGIFSSSIPRQTIYLGPRCLSFKQSRHPCIELLPDMAFIPNDVDMVKGKREFMIITGPNMSGKSTACVYR